MPDLFSGQNLIYKKRRLNSRFSFCNILKYKSGKSVDIFSIFKNGIYLTQKVKHSQVYSLKRHLYFQNVIATYHFLITLRKSIKCTCLFIDF